MKLQDSLTGMMLRLWRALEAKRRTQFVWLLLLMFVGSLAEVLSIGTVLPFLGALANPDKAFNQPTLRPFFELAGITSPEGVVLPMTLLFGGASLAAGAMRILVLRLSLAYSFGLGVELSTEVYRRTLHQPYAVHVARNSSEVINGIAVKTSEVIFYVITPTMTLISAGLMSVAIVVMLAKVLPASALGSFAVLGLLYALMLKFMRRRLKFNSEVIARCSTDAVRHLQEGLGGIRDILLDSTQSSFVRTFQHTESTLRIAQRDNSFVSLSPRYFMEAAGMVLIAMIAYRFTQSQNGIASVFPMLAALALGLQRLLPAAQQTYHSLSTIHGAEQSLRDMLALIEQPLPAERAERSLPLEFNSEILVKGLSFRYSPDTPWILKDLDLKITKGSRIGFVGQTGSGKSTLLDIVMGLLHPTQGHLFVDGTAVTPANVGAWRTHIAHVPQDIFLTDGTVRENIAFGVPASQIDDKAVHRAAHLAQIGTTIEGWMQGYETPVGERGVQLSGGQRQRIGIARALYRNADVIVFDEATSALDSNTEEAVMRSVEQLDQCITILIIAHRITTLKNCDRIVELSPVSPYTTQVVPSKPTATSSSH